MGQTFDIDLDAIEVPTETSATFRLDGRVWSCKHQDAIPATIADALFSGTVQVGPFFAAVLLDDDVDDFLELIGRPDTPLTLGRLQGLMEKLTETLVGYPTGRPSTSTTGSRPTVRSSGVNSSSRATARRRSAG